MPIIRDTRTIVSGVASVAKAGDAAITGAVTLSAGAGIALTEAGQNIAIAATPPLGATLTVTGNPSVADNGKIPWDTVVFDTGSFADTANNQLVVPVGKSGLLLVGFQANIQLPADNGASPHALLVNTGADQNIPFYPVGGTNADLANLGTYFGSTLVNCAAGDAFYVQLVFSSASNATVTGLNAVIWCVLFG